jgi:mono/diheme cytochrome c family protein
MWPVVATLALVLMLCGCGGRHRQPQTMQQRGRTVFAASCAGCHTLTGHDSRAPGGDLAIAKLSSTVIESFVRVMPVHLSAADVHAVAAYIHAAAIRTGR